MRTGKKQAKCSLSNPYRRLAACLMLLVWMSQAGPVSAALLFQDDFNDDIFYSVSTLAADGVSIDTVNDKYWTYAQQQGEYLNASEMDDALQIVTDSSFGAGIVLFGNQANLDTQCALGMTQGCVDPRLYFFNDPQLDPSARRTILVKGIKLNGVAHESYYAFKLRVGSTPGGILFRSHLEVSVSADRELRMISKVGAQNAVALFRSFYLQAMPNQLELSLGPVEYTVRAYFDFPVIANSGIPPLLSGTASYTGEHGLDSVAWLAETNGVEGGALFIGATSTDPQGSYARLSVGSVSVWEGAAELQLCQ